MTVNELINTLQTLQKEGEGESPIMVHNNHGRGAIECSQVDIVYVEDSYMSEDIYNVGEVDEAYIKDKDLIRAILLEN